MATKGLTPLQRAFEFARRAVTGQTLAGIDATGNRYYAWPEKAADGSMVERRQVKVAGGGGGPLFDPGALPPQWRAWLSKTRKDPPTGEELASAAARAAELRARVAAVEAREEARRLRAAALGRAAGGAAAGPDFSAFAAQLESRGFPSSGGSGGGGSGSGGGAPSAPSGGGGGCNNNSGAGQGHEPADEGVWRPPPPR